MPFSSLDHSINERILSDLQFQVIPSKTKRNKREIQIPIHDDLFDYLKALNRDKAARKTPVFPTLAKMSVNGADGLSNSFSDLRLKAGVSRGKPSRVIAEGGTKGKGRITWEKGCHRPQGPLLLIPEVACEASIER